MQPDTLSAQVLRAKNYPDGRLLKGRVEEGFFLYVAESIVVVLLTFRRGHIWTVGNGKGVDIWNDHWVPNSPSRKIDAVRSGSFADSR